MCKVTQISFTPTEGMFSNVQYLKEQFTDNYLFPYGGSCWTRLHLLPREKDKRSVKIRFLFESSHKRKIPDSSVDITFTENDNKTLTDNFVFDIEYTRIIGKGREIEHTVEITIKNSSHHDLMCTAESMFNMGVHLAEIGNNDDAVSNCEKAKYFLKDLHPDLVGDLKDTFQKRDGKMYADKAKEHIIQYFKAKKMWEHRKAKVEIDAALKNAKKAAEIDLDSKDFMKLQAFVSDIIDFMEKFVDGREKYGQAIGLEIRDNLEYCIFKCKHAIELFKEVNDALSKWDVKALKIEGLDNNYCFGDFSKKLKEAEEYHQKMEKLYRQQEDKNEKERTSKLGNLL